MKTIRNTFIMLLALGIAAACSELEDDNHYGNSDTVISNNELKIVNISSAEYIKSRSDLSSMDQLFQAQGIYDELQKKGQLSNMLVVTNDHFKSPEEKTEFVTRSHVSDISISPANLEDGTRLMMWHGKYVNVAIDSIGLQGNIIDHILFNNGAVKEVVKTTTGYIYVISEMIETPTSLYDFINDLGDDYSIFREMVLASGGKEFDRANSKAIGVNDQGNTVYDSVFIYRNTFFENVNFDMNSESLTATMLLPSNNIINDALADAHQRLDAWEMTRSDSIMKDWILKTSFFARRYTSAQMQTTEEQDLLRLAAQVEALAELGNSAVQLVVQAANQRHAVVVGLIDVRYFFFNPLDGIRLPHSPTLSPPERAPDLSQLPEPVHPLAGIRFPLPGDEILHLPDPVFLAADPLRFLRILFLNLFHPIFQFVL